MKMLVFGRNGQVARELRRIQPRADFLSRDSADLAQPDTCEEPIIQRRPDVVINAAAWTAVDLAESHQTEAYAINARAPAAMAGACARLGIPFIQLSTDYVFDGECDQPFRPDHAVAPLGVYGASKAAGEAAIREIAPDHAIVRTSWVFSAHGSNFVKTMLRLAQTRDSIAVVRDQVGGPTSATSIAEACVHIAQALIEDRTKSGTYHFSGSPDTNWAAFARAVFAEAGLATRVEDIATSAYPTPAKRPANSRLDCSATTTQFGLERPHWRACLASVIADLRRSI